MKIFDKVLNITKQQDGTFTINIALSDSVVVCKTIDKKTLIKLQAEIEKVLIEVS